MKTFKDHILEKLKVTSNNSEYENEYEKPTYQEYYDLLAKYCKSVPELFLDLGKIYNFDDDLLPKLKNDANKTIFTIRALYSTTPGIRIKTYDSKFQKSVSFHLYITEEIKNEKVDFMEDEYVEATVEYMKEDIK